MRSSAIVAGARLCLIATVRRVAFLAPASILLLAALAGAQGTATVEGTVAMPTPRAAPVSKPRYPVATSYEVGPPDPSVAVVYLEGEFPARPAPKATVQQRRYQFAPGVLAVARGTVVEFPNLDDEYHSVFSYSKPKRFDLGRYSKDERPAALTFDETGVVKLYCEIHDHMRGTILVLDTPYFVTTDVEGRYRLDGLPPGRWTLKAWVDDDTVRERTVELGTGATLQVDFPAEAAPAAP